MHWEACTVRKIVHGSVWFYTEKLYYKKHTLFARSSSNKLDELRPSADITEYFS